MRDEAGRARAGVLQLALKPQAEVEVRQLGLAVGAPWPVAAVKVRVRPVDGAAHVMGRAGHGHDPRAGCAQQRGQQQRG